MKQSRVSLGSSHFVSLLLAVPIAAAISVAGCGSSSSGSPGSGGGADAGAAGEPSATGGGGEGGVVTEPASGGEGGAQVTTEQEMFDALGVDTTPSPRTFTDDTGSHELGPDYNPLGRGVRSLQPHVEVYFAGRGLAGSTANQLLLDGSGVNLAKTELPIDDAADSWAATCSPNPCRWI